MEALIFFSGIAFVAGMVVRSLFTTQPPLQIIYVKPEPMERGDSGCLPLILVGALLLALLLVTGSA